MTIPIATRTAGDAPRTTSAARVEHAVRTNFFQRLARRLAAVAIVVLGVCGWLLRDFAARLDARTIALFLLAAIALGALVSFVTVAFVLARTHVRPAAALADLAETVADGDFAVVVPTGMSRGEVGRLARAVSRMLVSLRTLTRTVRTTADDISQAAAQVMAGGHHMAESAQHIADTSNELAQRAAGMSDNIDALVADAGRLVAIAGELTDGAHAGVARNAQLLQLARESGARLDESESALATLAEDAHSTAAAVDALAGASEEIRAFVTFVQKMARQSKLLALNAAMEAARAGEHGQGFAVVASEVRRLAAGAAEAAQRTEALVKGVLERVAESRAASVRTASTVDAVRAATQQGLESFRQVAAAAGDAERWTSTIEQAATSSHGLVAEMNQRLESLAAGTETFASAMEGVAAASQEQSASTQEIAAAGAVLAAAANQLSALVMKYRVDEQPSLAVPATSDARAEKAAA